MSRIAYVNGQYLPHRQANIHIEDRGFQFADGVYEVIAVVNGRMVDLPLHNARLERSLAELTIAAPMSMAALAGVLKETIRRNGVKEGIVYLQVNRGTARRDHVFPENVRPSVVVTARRQPVAKADASAQRGVAVVTMPDLRWARVDVKSVGLLPNAMAKQAAKKAGAFEAWLVDGDGYVTEGSATNAWIVDGEGHLVTRPATSGILNGVTRVTLMEIAKREGLTLIERKFTPAEALAAREVFLTSTTSYVMPIVSIDGKPVGNGHPGLLTSRLRVLYKDHVSRQVATD